MKFASTLSVLALMSPAATAFQPSFVSKPLSRATSLYGSPDEFVVGVLGDLHIDPRKFEDYEVGRAHWKNILEETRSSGNENLAVVSLGDLGESKNCDHNEDNPSELFAGTTACHELAGEFLRSFDVPYEVVGGNHGKFFPSCCPGKPFPMHPNLIICACYLFIRSRGYR